MEVDDDDHGPGPSASCPDGGTHPSGLKTHARALVHPSAEVVLRLYAFDVAASRRLISLWACYTVAFLAQWHSATFLFLFLSVL